MKFKDDEWLTDYVNALHFTVRWIETRCKDRDVAAAYKTEADAMIQEAILGNIPIEIFNVQRIAARVDAANAGANEVAERLISDYVFICDGLDEFTLDELIGECTPFFEKIYPGIKDIKATITAIFNKDFQMGRIEGIRPGVYRRVKL